MKKTYNDFLKEVKTRMPGVEAYTDELRRLAWGTDAGFYRLIPQIVVRAKNEDEVSTLLQVAGRHHLPVTFRAAGTSLSGQAISQSILIVAGKHWQKYTIGPHATHITLQPGIVGERVNQLLAPYKRKFGPDPASIKSAMVGGIVMNNASGMSCGTHANSDQTLLAATIIMADGTKLNTADTHSRQAFREKHPEILNAITNLRDKVRENKPLAERIRRKYSIKNVTGLNILPLLTQDDPFDIIAHLMVGSEGTLAFLSNVCMRTLPDEPCRASAMLYFNSLHEACRAVVAMKKLTTGNEGPVKAAELLDYKSLASVNDPIYIRYKEENKDAATGLTAVLCETKADNPQALKQHIHTIEACIRNFHTCQPPHFTDRPEEYARYWAIRSGIFPSVGGTRKPGTTCLIEDIAFHIEDLPEATVELQQLIARHGYDDACIYGHALEGNYHFIINQSFATPQEVKRYEALMEDVKKLVVDKYDGSLKAEHGTGRNMAPYVRQEWGDEAYEVMRTIKQIFDPENLLNPGVIFNDDPQCHIKNFKPLPMIDFGPQAEHITHKVNRCIECGFCEVNCVSCGLTLSSRQRIVLQRELARLKQTGEAPQRWARLQKQYRYQGNQTCAGDGLCSMSCPMGINTGDLTHLVRQAQLPPGSIGYKTGNLAARHLHGIKNILRPVLTIADFGHTLLGTKAMSNLTRNMHRLAGIPLWTPAMPQSHRVRETSDASQSADTHKVVYFPSCINQAMGLARKSPVEQVLVNKMVALLHKAGYEVIFPDNMDNLCCGTIWESKGMMDIADRKTAELEAALWKASKGGKYPVLCDQSPCLHRMREKITKMKLYEPAEFIYTHLRERLEFKPTDRPVAVHITCSMRKMGLADTLIALARLCSTHVFVPEEVGCCGFAGDRGFTHPELNAYALRKLRPQLEEKNIEIGYSNSRTCEIGLTTHSGIPYVSIAYLVDECTVRK